ncbi:MAG: hypothetical protein JXA00_02850 [Candidatus Thermoplasmatota archaeon]|nr:hypothetical protein [Candidatus Thermoplasmatota archaeon]
MKLSVVKIIGIITMLLTIASATQLSATPPVNESMTTTALGDEPPEITIVNPTEGYFHFSGIKLFPTVLNLVADTMGFGGFRVRPVQVSVTDDIDPPEDIAVYMYVYDEEQGNMTWNNQTQLFERKWIGPDLGVFTMNITAEDSTGNIGFATMDVWYFCFIPE